MEEAERRELLDERPHEGEHGEIPTGLRHVRDSHHRVGRVERQKRPFYTLHSSRLRELSRF